MDAFHKYRVTIAAIVAISAVFAFVFDVKGVGQDIVFGPSEISYWVISGIGFLVGFGWQSGVDGVVKRYEVKHLWFSLGFFAYCSLFSLVLIVFAPLLTLEGPFFPNANAAIGIIVATFFAIGRRRKIRTEQESDGKPDPVLS